MNIKLNQNQSNNVILTLQENSALFTYSGINPYYLFVFSSQTTNQSFNFVANNISSLSARNSYDQFTITCTGATYQNLSAGTIHLNPGMFWHYSVYEQTNQYNFNINNAVGLVEQGKVQYFPATQDFTYVQMTGDSTYTVFNTYN
ncbi:MAG TPA: hypothetical protein VNX68_12730 [Nitrosopumilaceae archaeon]|jgi:hypothetical protein|nr:hypothetical protein [Nitrosopumilaceae archaeon]